MGQSAVALYPVQRRGLSYCSMRGRYRACIPELVHLQIAPVDMILDTAGGSNHDVHAAAQR